MSMAVFTPITVSPLEKGRGWETNGTSVIRIVRLPWAIASLLILTSLPITIMPELSSITTLAFWSGWTCSCSTLVMRSTTRLRYSLGTCISTVPGSSDCARLVPRLALIASAIRREVVKSGLRRAILIVRKLSSSNGISFSMIAPFAIRPEVGTPRTTEEVAPWAAIPLTATCPCAKA